MSKALAIIIIIEAAMSKKTIDTILKEHISKISMGKNTERNIDITERYYAFNGNENSGMSMQEAGKDYDLTRESVRQITSRVIQYLRDTFEIPEELKEAISVIKRNLPSTGDNLKNILVKEGLLSPGVKIECVLNIIGIMEIKAPFKEVVKLYNDKLLLSNEKQDVSQLIESSAISKISHNGAASIEELSLLVPFGNKEFKKNFVVSIFRAMTESKFTDDLEWVFFLGRGRNRLINRINSIFSVIKETNIGYINHGIKRNWKKNEKEDKTQVLDNYVILSIIKEMGCFDITEDGVIRSKKRVKLEEPLKHFESSIFNLIKKSKEGFCKEKELEDALLKSPTEKWAFSVALNYSPLFMKVKDEEKSKIENETVFIRGQYYIAGIPF